MSGTEIDKVLEAAAALDIAEVQLFRKAYRKWFGRPVGEDELDRYFVAYMFAGVVPYWVRDYARRVLDSASRHTLDPVRFGVLPVLRRHPRLGWGLLIAQFVILAALVFLTDWSLQFLPEIDSCLLPPCY